MIGEYNFSIVALSLNYDPCPEINSASLWRFKPWLNISLTKQKNLQTVTFSYKL